MSQSTPTFCLRLTCFRVSIRRAAEHRRRLPADPSLLLWGERDALFPLEDQDRLVATIPDAKLRLYSEIGHCPTWECPDEVAHDLFAFMSGSRSKES